MKISHLLGLLILVVLLVGCSPITQAEQEQILQTTTLEIDQTAGQTFTAAYDGLEGIEVYLIPNGELSKGEMQLELRESPFSKEVIAQSSLSLPQISKPGYYRFAFPTITRSGLADYYFSLEINDIDRIELGTAPGDTYLDGSQYADDQPVDAQLSFRVAYSRFPLLVGLLREGLSWLGILLASCFLFILPGWVLLDLLWSGWRDIGLLEKISISVGVSVALYPVLFLWGKLIHLQLGALFAWGPPVTALFYLILKNRKNHLNILKVTLFSVKFWANLAIFILLALIVFIRFWVVREINVPLWGDSYQHTVMTQLIIENRGLFDTWLPYADLYSLTYHYGFQGLAALLHWVTGLSAPQSVLWTGQVLNVFAILVIIPLALKVKRSLWMPAVVLLIAGLFSSMPMFYTNWGRYTQLAGQVILPVAVWLVWEITEQLPESLKNWFLLGIVWAGLALTHYRVFLIGGLFLLVLIIFLNRKLFPILKYARFAVTGSIGMILLLPWLLKGYNSGIVTNLITTLSTPAASIPHDTQSYNTIGQLSNYAPIWMWFLALISLGSMLWRHDQKLIVLSTWAGVTLFACNPSWLNLPGDGIISNFALFIFSYFWLTIFIATTADFIIETFIKEIRLPQPILQTLLFSVFIIVSLAQLPIRRTDVQIKPYQLFTRADERAARWIQKNTPKDSTFIVNSMFAYSDSLIVGTDGGWWLPLIARRNTTVPPLTYGVETGPIPDYIRWINILPSEIIDKGLLHPKVISLMRDRKITHLYIGQRQGSVNYSGPELLDPEAIKQDPNFRLIYHQDRVWIFSLQP